MRRSRRTLAVQPSLTIAVKRHVGSTKQPRGREVLEDNAIAMRKPIRYICAPDHFSKQGDIAIQQVGRIHDLVDVERVVGQNYTAVDAAEVEGLEDGGSVVDRMAEVGECLWEYVAGGSVVDNESYGCRCSCAEGE